jgi:beta-N-acetylhexosaminidase
VGSALARGRVLLVVAAVVVGVACRSAVPPDVARLAALEPALGQLLLVGFAGTDARGNRGLERLLCESRIGGALLFGRNIIDAEQVARLTRSMTEMSRACTGGPLLVGIDAEGGRVMRLSPAAGYTPTLSHQELGDDNDLTLTQLEARRIARMLRAAGINWNLAPVVDVGYNPANPVIVAHGRSFSGNPALVTEHARAYIRGMRAEGVLTALKHFPGHGSSFADSHHGFVDVSDTAAGEIELAPYRALIREQFADSIMTAHVFNRHRDRCYPATLSRATVEGLLRNALGYDGVVVTDDLRMGAIEQHYGIEAAGVLALRAGADLLLIADDRLSGDRSAADVVLGAIRKALGDGRLDAGRVASAIRRVEQFKSRLRE